MNKKSCCICFSILCIISGNLRSLTSPHGGQVDVKLSVLLKWVSTIPGPWPTLWTVLDSRLNHGLRAVEKNSGSDHCFSVISIISPIKLSFHPSGAGCIHSDIW